MWPPLQTCLFALIVRGIVACCAGRYWFIGISLIYFAYMVAVIIGLVQGALKIMPKQQIDKLSLYNMLPEVPPTFADISTNSVTVLAMLSLLYCFVLLVLIAASSQAGHSIPQVRCV